MSLELRNGYLVEVNAEGVETNTFCTAIDLLDKRCNLLTSDVTVALPSKKLCSPFGPDSPPGLAPNTLLGSFFRREPALHG